MLVGVVSVSRRLIQAYSLFEAIGSRTWGFVPDCNEIERDAIRLVGNIKTSPHFFSDF
jgi:hypothetical protein